MNALFISLMIAISSSTLYPAEPNRPHVLQMIYEDLIKDPILGLAKEAGHTLSHWAPSILVWRAIVPACFNFYTMPDSRWSSSSFISNALNIFYPNQQRIFSYERTAGRGYSPNIESFFAKTPHPLFIPIQAAITGAINVYIHRLFINDSSRHIYVPRIGTHSTDTIAYFAEAFVGELSQKYLNKYCNDGYQMGYNFKIVMMHLALSKIARFTALCACKYYTNV